MKKIRVRFAPSPTGALHIGGIRTALYNYLIAKKYGGTFILRIEDTDQVRYVPGAEEYIIEALQWAGIIPDEGPGFGGDFGPYRQSERKDIYEHYAQELVKRGHAYYAFDTPEALEARRQSDQDKGAPAFKYDHQTRQEMVNSLTIPESEVKARIERGDSWVIRLKVPENETISVVDLIRGEVEFQSNELDDKVILKADGMPTYHLANIVDDHLMRITNVIRGEEWLPSTAHHVLLYRGLGWEETMPTFAHLPLILKPSGQGKLSKRDGFKLGIPVFPIAWKGETPEESFTGFREFGFLPEAMINFLALLGWNPGTDQEIFSLDELQVAFSIEKIGKSGSRFDFEKAKWFNQQYIMACPDDQLAHLVRPFIAAHGHHPENAFLHGFCSLMKERVTFLPEFWENGRYFFEDFESFDEQNVRKRWDPGKRTIFEALADRLDQIKEADAVSVHEDLEAFMQENSLKPGDVLPLLRIALIGSMKGPGVSEMIALLGTKEVRRRILRSASLFDQVVQGVG